MAVKAACVRAVIDIFHRRVPLTAYGLYPGLQHGRHFVNVSKHYLSPQPPKKPPGAFFNFMNSKSPEILSKNPGSSIAERAKIASGMWQNMDPEEKDRLKLEANEELQEFRKKYLMFLDGLSDQERTQFLLQKRTKRQARANRKHRMELRKFGKPKLPPNAYMLFVRSSRLERGSAPPTQFIKGLVEYWKQMPQEEKEIYVEDAKIEKQRYEQEMKEWEERMKEMGREDLIRKKSQTKPKKVRASKVKKKTAKKPKAKMTAKSKATDSKTLAKPKPKATVAKPTAKATSQAKKKTLTKGIQTEE